MIHDSHTLPIITSRSPHRDVITLLKIKINQGITRKSKLTRELKNDQKLSVKVPMEILFRPVQTGLINDKYDNSSFLHKHSSHLHVINFDQHGLYGAPFVKYFLAFFHTFTIVWCNYKNALNVMYFPMRYLFYKGRPIGLWSLSN